MLKKFFTIVLGSFVGAWLAMIVVTITSIVMSFAFLSAMSDIKPAKKALTEGSVLYLDLGMQISERKAADDPMNMMMNQDVKTAGLNDLVAQIETASQEPKIEGMYIDCKGISAGNATLLELRKAIETFKASGKFVYAYGYQGIPQGDYYLASVADSIFINPSGMVDIHGMAAQNLLFKKLLDKVGVEMQVLRVGTFKSAVEPYMLTEISEANRMQQEQYLGNIWGEVVGAMAQSRGISVERLNEMADSLVMTKNCDYLLANRLIDGVCYKSEMKKKLEAKVDGEMTLVSPEDIEVVQKIGGASEIAVVYAEGEIDGSTTEGIISDELTKTIEELTEREEVACMVLRVNSPGGSAFGSEQIWKSIEDFKAAGKKVVVSMGDLAASGGYYISCNADRIFAEPVTLTGSIGIFGVIPCFEELTTETLGVTSSVVKTNANADFGSLIQKMTPSQTQAMQEYINRGYDLFTKRCADGRGMSQDSIKAIAEGRVWDGKKALEIGLVDELGSLADAIAYAKELSEIGEEYTVNEYPALKSQWERMLEKYMENAAQVKMREELGVLYDYQQVLKKLLSRDKVLCLMEPFEIK